MAGKNTHGTTQKSRYICIYICFYTSYSVGLTLYAHPAKNEGTFPKIISTDYITQDNKRQPYTSVTLLR